MKTVSIEEVMERLRTVIDPEVGLNIVDMGLVYGVEVRDGAVEIRMTLTTRGCPMSAYLNSEVDGSVRALDGVRDVRVELVWTPAWSPDRIKPEALEALRVGRTHY